MVSIPAWSFLCAVGVIVDFLTKARRPDVLADRCFLRRGLLSTEADAALCQQGRWPEILRAAMQGAATCLFARWLDEVDVKVVMGRDLLDSAYNTGTQLLPPDMRELKQEMASSDGGGVTGSLSWLRTSRSTLPSTRSSIRRWPRIWASPSSTGITSKGAGKFKAAVS